LNENYKNINLDDIFQFFFFIHHPLTYAKAHFQPSPTRRRGTSCLPLLLGEGRGEVKLSTFRSDTNYFAQRTFSKCTFGLLVQPTFHLC